MFKLDYSAGHLNNSFIRTYWKIKMFQIKPQGIITDTAKVMEIQRDFAERQCVLLNQVIDHSLLGRLMKQLANAPTQVREPGKAKGRVIARELCVERDAVVLQALTMLFNRPEIFRLIEQVTGCPAIGSFLGRIYMMQPNSGHYDTWHSDYDGNRLIGLSLNLSNAPYSGGVFQIRQRQPEQLISEIANIVPGDAHIFRISKGLQHCVTPVTGEITKIAFAGWFQANPY
jgi:hypothetical protein